MTRPFHPSELSGADDREPTSVEAGDALATARALETQLGAADVHPSAGFADRVMEAVAAEPRPQPAIAAGLALRRGRVGAMVAALADSWRVAFSGGRPLAVRAQAAGFVLVAIVAAGSIGGVALVGAIDVLAPNRSPAPAPTTQPTPVVRPTPSPDHGPAETTRPAATTQPTETPEATETPEPSETPDGTKTERPERTDHPETPEPAETPEPGDHGGGGSGGGGGGGGGEDPSPDN